jgi:hypothetical protein
VGRATEDLFTPTLQDAGRHDAPVPGERPWRLSSQFYVAFFGGALAVTALAWVNARRLGAPLRVHRWILGAGGAGVVVSTVASYLLYGNDYGAATRIAYRIVGIAVSGVQYKLQESPDRIYRFRYRASADELYDRMVGPGLAATLAGGAVQFGIIALGMVALETFG